MEILRIILFTFIGLIIFNVLNIYILRDLKINKWIIFTLAFVSLLMPWFLNLELDSFLSRYVFPGVFVFLFLWFLDLLGLNNRMQKEGQNMANKRSEYKRKKNDVIKPKPKPNRVKHRDK